MTVFVTIPFKTWVDTTKTVQKPPHSDNTCFKYWLQPKTKYNIMKYDLENELEEKAGSMQHQLPIPEEQEEDER
jgi:hypothetical protein